MVNKELLEILICPACHGDLQYDPDKATLTCQGQHCPECGMGIGQDLRCLDEKCGKQSDHAVGLRYHVEDDIPVMLIDEAEKIVL